MKLLFALVLGIGGCIGQPTVSGSWTANDTFDHGNCYEQGFFDDLPTERVTITITDANGDIIGLDKVPCSDGGFSIPVRAAADVQLTIDTEHSGRAVYAIDRVGDSDVDVGDVTFVED